MLDVLEHMNVDGKLAKQLKNENINAVPALYELLKMLRASGKSQRTDSRHIAILLYVDWLPIG